MTLDQSALLELTEAMRTADDSTLMRTLLHTILQALVDAEATETAMATAIRAATVRPIEGPAPQTSVKAWNAFGFAADLARPGTQTASDTASSQVRGCLVLAGGGGGI